jgi:hypothetical protein
LPNAYVIEPGWCWPGVDLATWPPGYRLGFFRITVLADGLTEHIRRMEEKAVTAAVLRHNERLKRIKSEMEGG